MSENKLDVKTYIGRFSSGPNFQSLPKEELRKLFKGTEFTVVESSWPLDGTPNKNGDSFSFDSFDYSEIEIMALVHGMPCQDLYLPPSIPPVLERKNINLTTKWRVKEIHGVLSLDGDRLFENPYRQCPSCGLYSIGGGDNYSGEKCHSPDCNYSFCY